MAYVIVGLGNPGAEYERTRHNAGREAVMQFSKLQGVDAWSHDKKLNALAASAEVSKEKVTLVLPETFMNKSGNAVKPLAGSAKKAEQLIVVHDDLDLPIGSIKIVFNRGSGGHRGVESIMRAIKTEGFVRIRIGVSSKTAKGLAKKPDSSKVNDFILKKLGAVDEKLLKSVYKKVSDALAMIVSEGRERAMGAYN